MSLGAYRNLSFFGTRGITKKGMTLFLDPGNPMSYSGSGEDWFDIGEFGNDAILETVGSKTPLWHYDIENLGSFFFSNSSSSTFASYGRLSDNSSLQTNGPFSLSIWLKGYPIQSTGQFCGIFAKSDENNFGDWSCAGDTDNNYFRFGFLNTSNTNKTYQVPDEYGKDLRANTWINYQCTYDGNFVRIYRNGELVVEEVETTTPSIKTTDVRISSRGTSAFAFAAFTGNIGPIMFYNQRALNRFEIDRNYHAFLPRYRDRYFLPVYGRVLLLDAGNASSYPGSGTSWFDLSGIGRDSTTHAPIKSVSTLVNGPTYTSEDGGAIIFDGVDDRVNTNNTFNDLASGLLCSSGNEFSVSVWFRWVASPTVHGSANHSHMIVGRAGGIGSGATFGIFGSINTYNNGAGGDVLEYGKLGMVLRGRTTVASNTRIDDENWHHACFTWDGSVGKIYHNGSFIKNANVGTASLQNYTVGLGNRSGNQDNNNHRFQGRISHCMIHRHHLSPEEVSQIFNALRGRYGI